MTNLNLYFHKDFEKRCIIEQVFSSGRTICRIKNGITFECWIGDLSKIY